MAIQLIRLSQIKSNIPGFIDFEQQLISMFGDDTTEKFIATEGQTIITLGKEYVVGRDSIKVFVNGILQISGESNGYLEINPKMIGFTEPLIEGDVVIVIFNRLVKHAMDMGKNRVKAYDIYRSTTFITDMNSEQTTFKTPYKYQPGLNQLKVYANGLLLTPGASFNYIELSDDEFKLNQKLPVGTTLTMEVIAGGLNVYKSDRYPFFIDEKRSVQKDFTLPKVFKVNKNNLKVYLNGVLLRKGINNDYIEFDDRTFRMNYDLPVGSLLEAEITTFTIDVFTITRQEYIVTEYNKLNTAFKTSRSFNLGESNLRVYMNGILLREGELEDYIEIDNDNFKFNDNELVPGTVIEYEIITW